MPSDAHGSKPAVDVFQILESLPIAVSATRALRDDDGRITDFIIEYLNPAAAALAHVHEDARDQIVGKGVLELVPALEGMDLVERYREVVETGRPFKEGQFEFQGEVLGEPIAGIFELEVTKFGDGYISVSRDITQQLKIQEELAAARSEIEQRRFKERQSAEINDNIINSLVLAADALDKGDTAGVKRALTDTLHHASRIVTELKTLPRAHDAGAG